MEDIKKHKLAGPDHLRALAITLVFLFHYSLFPHPGWVDTLGSFGWTGVDLFFVLSGYLIAGQLFKQLTGQGSIAAKAFFLKRVFRILPAYLVVVALYCCVPAFREREALPPLWKFLSFTQNFGLDLRHNGTFSHAWSLCIEEQFYLLLPFFILCFISLKWGKKAAFLLIGLLFMLGFLMRLTTWYRMLEPLISTDAFGLSWYKWMYYPTYNRLDGLLAGVSIAGLQQFYPRARSFIARYGYLLLATGLAILCGAYYLCLNPRSFAASVFGFPVIAVGYGCLLAAAIAPSCFLSRARSKFTSATAALSYAVYLVHKGIIHIAQEQAGRLGIEKDSSVMFLLCIMTTLAAALILRYTVEKPFLRLRDRLLHRSADTYRIAIADSEHQETRPVVNES